MKFFIVKQKGLSLVEMLVAIFVGILLLTGVLQIVVNSTQSYRIQNSIMRVQENGQFAMEFLARDIRNTDFWGCLTTLDDVNNLLDPAGPGYNVLYGGFTEGISGTANESGGGAPLSGTDTITVRAAGDISGGSAVQFPYGPLTSSPINLGAGKNVQAGDILLVGDCLTADIFQATAVDANGEVSHDIGSGSPGNVSADFSKVYTNSAFVYRPVTHVYDVRTGTNGGPALYLTDTNGNQELVEGIENMIIFYGEDTDGDGTANLYVRANLVTDMNNVVSVRINLLVRSFEDNLRPVPQPYLFNGQTITPTDNRLRRVYTSTIVLRNRSR